MIWQIFWKIFYLKGLRPQNSPLLPVHIIFIIFPIIKKLWPARKLKNFRKLCIFHEFSEEFFYIYLCTSYFEKLPKIFGLFPIVKVRSDPRKIGPSKHLADSLKRKIQHALLQIFVKMQRNEWKFRFLEFLTCVSIKFTR